MAGVQADMSAGTPDSDGTGDDEEWRFSVEEVGEDDTDADQVEDSGNVAGSLVEEGQLEPESISLESAVFFLVGALGTILFVVLAIAGL
jgi:hypothetical protein